MKIEPLKKLKPDRDMHLSIVLTRPDLAKLVFKCGGDGWCGWYIDNQGDRL